MPQNWHKIGTKKKSIDNSLIHIYLSLLWSYGGGVPSSYISAEIGGGGDPPTTSPQNPVFASCEQGYSCGDSCGGLWPEQIQRFGRSSVRRSLVEEAQATFIVGLRSGLPKTTVGGDGER